MSNEVNSLRQIAEEVRNRLGVEVDIDQPEVQVRLALMRAAREMVPLLEDGHHAEAIVREWMEALSAGAGGRRWLPVSTPSEPPSPNWASVLAEAENVAGGLVIYLALFQLLAPGIHEGKGVEYLDQFAEKLGIEPHGLRIVQGWFNDQADGEIRAMATAVLEEMRGRGTLAKELLAQVERSALPYRMRVMLPADRWEAAQRRIKEWTTELGTVLRAFGFDSSGVPALGHLERYLETDRFRLAVLGEFKRGKSTLINAMVGMPRLLPADVRPCTSGLIELRWGEALRYELNDGGPLASFHEVAATDFSSRAGDAYRRHESAGATATTPIMRWRLHVPSQYLRENEIDLIDTPGLGEDYGRDAVARAEAQLADAAILVFSAQQPTTLQELGLLESMKAKARNVIIAINYADNLEPVDRDKVLDYVRKRLRTVTDAVPPEHVVLVSAKRAVDALAAGRSSDEWHEGIADITQLARKHILRYAAPLRVTIVARRIDEVTREMSEKLTGFVGIQRALLADLEGREAAVRRADDEHRRAKQAIEAAEAFIRRGGEDCAAFLDRAFAQDLPPILDEVGGTKEKWQCESSVISSPRIYAKGIATAAQRAFGERVQEWLAGQGERLVIASLQEALEGATRELAPLKDYLSTAMPGRDFDATLRHLREDTLGLSLDVDAGDTAVSGLARAVGMAALGGYVIADIVLFYLLGMISGFLNPGLLVAAVAVGTLLLITGGRARVEAAVKDQVFKVLRSRLESDEIRAEIQKLVGQSVKAIFDRVAVTFREAAMAIVNEADAQLRLARLAVEDLVQRSGRDRAGFDAYLADLESRRAQATRVFERMHAEVDDLRASMETPSDTKALPPAVAAV